MPLQRTWPSVRSLFLMRTSSFATKYFDDVSSDCFIFDIEISLTKICFVLLLWNNMVSNHIKDTNLYCLDRRYTYFINKKWWQSNIKFRIWLSEYSKQFVLAKYQNQTLENYHKMTSLRWHTLPHHQRTLITW